MQLRQYELEKLSVLREKTIYGYVVCAYTVRVPGLNLFYLRWKGNKFILNLEMFEHVSYNWVKLKYGSAEG